MIIDQLFTRPIFEAADPSRLIATITLSQAYNADEPTKEVDLTGRFQGDVKSQMNQAADYLTQFLQSKGFNFTSIQLKYQGMVMNAQNRGSMTPQSDWEKEAEATANQMRAKRSVQNTAPALNEFARGEGGGSGNYFKALASAWYNGTNDSGSLQKGIKTKEDIERLLDRGIVAPDGVTRKYNIDYNSDFDGVIIFSDDYYEHGDDDETDSRTGQPFGPYDYMEFSDDDLTESAMAEGRKKKKTSRSLGRYFFPGFGYYGSGDAGEGGGGGGESANPGMAEGEYDSRKPFGVRYKVFAGREGRMTTREYWTSSEEKLQRAVDKIQALDNFYEIDGYSYPKQSQDLTEVFADQGSGSTDRDNADYMKKRNAAKKAGYTGRETKAGTWRVFKDGNAVAAAGPFKSADEAAAWIKKHKQGVTEMDKSEPSAGRDTGPRPGPDKEARPVAAKKATRDAGRMLNKAFRDSHKKKDVKEGLEQFGDEYLRKAADPNRFGRFLISVEQAQAELDARAQGKQQVPPPAPPPAKSQGFSKEYLQKAADPNRFGRYMISVEKAQELLKQMNENIDPLMKKLRRAMVREGRVKELADDLKTMRDADFMKKYGKAKAAIRKDMSRIDEKLTTSDTLSRPAAKASSGKAIDDPDIMGSLKSASTPKFDRFSKTDSEPKIDFRAGLVGDETEVKAEPRLMVDPLPDMQKWGGKFATGNAGGDNRFTAPAGWRYVEKDEDPARYGSAPAAAAAGGGLPDLKYDPQSRTLKSADAPALDLSPKSKYKFDRTAQGQVPADGSGANPNIDNATRDRARAYAAQQNAPADAAKKVDWKTIYALNKATIGSNPNLIRPRMQLNMPNGTIYLVQPGDTLTKIAAKQNQVNELSTEKLAQYKTAAARDARQADQEGDVKRGDKRFSGIVKATKKQFDNDAKKVDESRAARRALMAQIVNHR